jgi:serine/threonine-protein kinase RsbW
MSSDAPQELTVDARLENLPILREFVERACAARAPDSVCFALKLAVDEACSNIVEHGYARSTSGPLRLIFASDGHQITVTINDHSPAYEPEQSPAPDLTSDLSARRVGGLGWYLIFHMMDEVHYQSDAEHGNTLTLIKRLA